MVLAINDEQDLRHAWDLVVTGIEKELLNRCDITGPEAEPYVGRGGPVRTKFVQAKCDIKQSRDANDPVAKAWIAASRWAKHIIRLRAFWVKLISMYRLTEGLDKQRISLPDYSSP